MIERVQDKLNEFREGLDDLDTDGVTRNFIWGAVGLTVFMAILWISPLPFWGDVLAMTVAVTITVVVIYRRKHPPALVAESGEMVAEGFSTRPHPTFFSLLGLMVLAAVFCVITSNADPHWVLILVQILLTLVILLLLAYPLVETFNSYRAWLHTNKEGKVQAKVNKGKAVIAAICAFGFIVILVVIGWLLPLDTIEAWQEAGRPFADAVVWTFSDQTNAYLVLLSAAVLRFGARVLEWSLFRIDATHQGFRKESGIFRRKLTAAGWHQITVREFDEIKFLWWTLPWGTLLIDTPSDMDQQLHQIRFFPRRYLPYITAMTVGQPQE